MIQNFMKAVFLPVTRFACAAHKLAISNMCEVRFCSSLKTLFYKLDISGQKFNGRSGRKIGPAMIS